MELPDFNPVGVLPPGIHTANEEMLRRRFVAGFPESLTRSEVFQSLLALRAILRDMTDALLQWIDGSFVEGKRDPNDVDLVNFLSYDALNAMESDRARLLLRIAKGIAVSPSTRLCDIHFALVVDADHALYNDCERLRLYWRRWFGFTRSGVVKGFVSLPLGDVSQSPHVSDSEESQ